MLLPGWYRIIMTIFPEEILPGLSNNFIQIFQEELNATVKQPKWKLFLPIISENNNSTCPLNQRRNFRRATAAHTGTHWANEGKFNQLIFQIHYHEGLSYQNSIPDSTGSLTLRLMKRFCNNVCTLWNCWSISIQRQIHSWGEYNDLCLNNILRKLIFTKLISTKQSVSPM